MRGTKGASLLKAGAKRLDCTRRPWFGREAPQLSWVRWQGVLAAPLPCIAPQRLKSTLLTHGIFRLMASAPRPAAAPVSFESALEELEQLVARLESGDMPLDQLLTGYQRGAELLKLCRDRLEAVEGQIKVLDQGVLKTWTPE
jgi:exodeoxyribonuclease VII small subunit